MEGLGVVSSKLGQPILTMGESLQGLGYAVGHTF